MNKRLRGALLENLSYEAVDFRDGKIVIRVTADCSNLLAAIEDEDES